MAAGIVGRGVAEVEAGAAAVGPGIGPCCYEVGDEVRDAFGDLGEGISDGRMLDLREVARRLLVAAGVERLEISELCTSCNPELFFSHRRDGERTGRQAGLVWMAA
jgi:copper oxidase (laccase) domain-containing protein